MKDLKEGLTSKRKPDITHVRTPFLNYCARACEYGDAKYERANYLRPMETLKGDYLRLRQYLRAAVNHIIQTLDSMEQNQATDPNLTEETAMKIAAYSMDTDAKPGCKIGASHLPHLAHAAASLNMAIAQACYAGLLPLDPGRPWEEDSVSFGPTDEVAAEVEAKPLIPYSEELVDQLKGVLRNIDGADCSLIYSNEDKDMIEVPGRGAYFYDKENPYGSKNKYMVSNSEVLERTETQIAVKTGAFCFRVYDQP